MIVRALLVLALALLPSLAGAAPSKKDLRKGQQLARRAINAYQRRLYKDAADLFLQAYALTRHPVQVRNAAKASEEGGDLVKAKELWQRFVEHDDISGDERREGQAHVALIEERQRREEVQRTAEEARAAASRAEAQASAAKAAAEKAAETAVVQSLKPAPEPEPDPPYAAYVGIGVGTLLAASGGVVWVLQSRKTNRLDERIAQRDVDDKIIGITPREVDDDVSSINDQRLISGILAGTGTAVILGSVVWMIIDAQSRPEVTPQVGVSPSGASLSVVGRF